MQLPAEQFLHAAQIAQGVPDADPDAVLNIFRSYLERYPKRPANVRLACIAVAVLPFAVVLREICLRPSFSNDEVEQFFFDIVLEYAPPGEIGACLDVLHHCRATVFASVYVKYVCIAQHAERFACFEMPDNETTLLT
jgi:hypothetical protein